MTAADQAKINKFARLNSKLEEVKASLKKLQVGRELWACRSAALELLLSSSASPWAHSLLPVMKGQS